MQSSGTQSLADVLAALGAELGLTFTTQALTEQGVDLLTVRCQAVLIVNCHQMGRASVAHMLGPCAHVSRGSCFSTVRLSAKHESHLLWLFAGIHVCSGQHHPGPGAVGSVNDTSSSLASTLSQAFGDDSLQRDSQLDVQVMQLYQVGSTVAGALGFTSLSACSTTVA